MPTRQAKATSDINVWGAVNNDAMFPCLQDDKILIVANSNNPPTVQAYTKFYVYGTDVFTAPSSPATGNNVYPASGVLTYLDAYSVFELADQTFVWNTAASGTSAGIPSKANSTTYYLFCTGSQDVDATSRGKGLYGVSTNAPTWSDLKDGWYSSDGKVICRFTTDGSGNVGNISAYSSNMSGWNYFLPAFTNLTVGNATLIGRYTQKGKTVAGRVSVTMGSTSSTSGAVTFTLPVTAISYGTATPIGLLELVHSGTKYTGQIKSDGTIWIHSASTYVTNTAISNTVPYAGGPTNADTISISFVYEAA